MELAKNLVSLCKEKGLTLAALARKSGVKQPTLHGWSTGRKVHNLDDLKKVCTILEVSLHFILYGEPDPYENQDFFEELICGKIKITLQKIKKESNYRSY